ncbi:hypothetical protein PHSY_003332 [Pseudozyma hubeiensis SY62]|uniref:Zn(2)-C6 fungal-type domain-containing protein n=1 Tax=Pseudozyma hubeiensis (strain SY62) TaxID=1305764 RepID=R9P336_PSEHS|nr:hypothetical protein PHSY_003332 [Pseudozyma hubeiensis SY62]GAC95756.1 hypothetical protein PHSY_003332 [Pseudozyma hubeiensis SY62]
MANNATSSQHSKRDSSTDSDPSTSRADTRPDADSNSREEVKIYKTISRVHRACNACRKQKARCDGPENPPCRRCKQVGIECVFEKPPKDPASSASAALDAGASSDRIRMLESQMSGMQSMISELVASIKANTSAITAPPQASHPLPPHHSPQASNASSSSPGSSRASRSDPYHHHRQHNIPLQQRHPYAPPPHHRGSQQAVISPSAETFQRYPAEATSTSHPQRPPYPPPGRSFGSSNSVAGVGSSSLQSIPVHGAAAYPLQQPPFQTAYGHPPTKSDQNLLQQPQQLPQHQQQQHEVEAFSHQNMWNTTGGVNAAASSSSQATTERLRRRSGSRVGFDQEDRGRKGQSWQHPGLVGSSTSPADAAAAVAATSGWTPASSAPSHQARHSSRRRWTSSDRANSHSHSLDQNLTPSDGVAPGDDVDSRETDISNDQLSAPIEALRGLADAAAAAAESEGHTSNDSSDEKQTEEAGGRTKQGESIAAPSLQLVDEGGKRTAFGMVHDGESSDASGRTPRKKRRRDTLGDSPNSAVAAAGGLDSKASGASASVAGATSGGGGPNSASAPSPSGGSRSGKMEAPGLVSSAPGDLVTLGLVNETDAIRLFETFQKGVPKFISIFHLEDESMTTEEAYHYVRTTSYFLFNVMLAIGAKVECGGKSASRLYQTCMAQAKRNAKDTMFSPVAGKAAVQAMVLLAAYSENGWLPLGLSIRMAQELGLDRSFQKLMSALPSSGYIRHPQPPPPPKHLTFYHNSPSSHYTGSPTDVNSVGGESVDGKVGANAAGANAVAASAAASGNADAAAKRELDELKDLARGSRLWFFLFLFDHQASYGAGRPAMLSKHYVRNCRAFLKLNYPLTVKTDARFISTLELLIIRETHYDAMAPYDQPVDARMLSKMRKVTEELNEWHQYWSADFDTRGYTQESFFQQSLVLQCASAELYLTCTALRGIRDAADADQMGPEQKELIIQATRAADTCLSISVNAKEYREMLGWAPHYTHVTAAFACVFLIKIARLFPRQVDTYGIFSNAERLASRLAEVPAVKYARVIRILLAQAWKKIADLSPAIGLYAALGAEATRPGAITPAEIKSGGPSDSGISLLYKLLHEYQSGQIDDEATEVVNSNNGVGEGQGGSGTRTPGFGDLISSGKWLTAGISSPSVAAGLFGGNGSGTMSPSKNFSHRGSISGIELPGSSVDGIPWSSFLAAPLEHNANANQPIQLPVWMQESTGTASADLEGFTDSLQEQPIKSPATTAAAAAAGGRSWNQQDHYQSPVPHHYASTPYQTPGGMMGGYQGQGQGHHRHSNSLSLPGASPGTTQMQVPQQQQQQQQQQGGGGMTFAASTNFDSVLSDLGLPLDGLDGLFVDLPMGGAGGGGAGGSGIGSV